jgi:regulator of replication initiation timing
LEVSKAPVEVRSHINEVAEVLEEILALVEEKEGILLDNTHLNPRPRKAPGKILNEARKQKEEEQKKEAE